MNYCIMTSNLLWNSYLFELFFSDENQKQWEAMYIYNNLNTMTICTSLASLLMKMNHIRIDPGDIWLSRYEDTVFYQLFRMKKETFHELLDILLQEDTYYILKTKYSGGNEPIKENKKLLIFLWYMASQDTLHSISDRFNIVKSTSMKIINQVLHLVNNSLRKKYISWPKSRQEYESIKNAFTSYPGVIGVVDGTHITIKVSKAQQDSYIDRYQNYSINVMAICNFHKIFTYVFAGFPGSAHDSRVFYASLFVKKIQRNGAQVYFPDRDMHILGDKAFPLREWLIVPYRDTPNITREKKHHNYMLSKSRICIEHAFGLVKGRWRRLQYINSYSMAKTVEIANAAFLLCLQG